jgi:hypothetical protein
VWEEIVRVSLKGREREKKKREGERAKEEVRKQVTKCKKGPEKK